MNNQGSESMSPEKAAFLAQLLSETRAKNKSELLPFLFSLSSRINQSGISFSDEETNFIVSQFTQGFSPQEQRKVQMLRQFSQILAQNKNSSKNSRKNMDLP